MRFQSILLLIILNFFSISASAQYYDTGQDPASLKWLQINTKRFKVIYPEKYGSNGIEFARSLDRAYSDLASLFPDKKFKIPVIIHNFTSQSNGYVAWAPKRIEIYPTPEQNTIPLGTNRQLALHELTHVMQMESLNTGFSKVMSFVLGQQFSGVMVSMLPLWYMEGDAVFAESALSESGRGRSPGFQKQLKAIIFEKGHLYKYDKMLNGSFRDFIPDHYQLGYQMVAWSRNKYDLQLWNKILRFTANEPFTINPVNISLRRNAGLTKKSLFTQTFDSLKTLWKEDIVRSGAITYEPINRPKKGSYINYYSPLPAGADSIIAIKTSLSELPSFVLINRSDKSEKKLHTPGFIYPWFLSYARGKLVWVEIHSDPRWENRNYSVIRLKDIHSGITKQLSHGSRYMSASISPDGKVIAASENTIDNKNNLVFINSSDGNVMLSVQAPGNASLQHPQWSDDSRLLTVIYLTEEGEGIMSYSIAEKSWKVLIEPARDDLQSAFLRNDSLFFITSISGTDNIFVLTGKNKISEITRSKFGVNDLTVNGSAIMFTDYTADGNNICITSLGDAMNNNYVPVKPVSYLINRFDIEPGKATDVSVTDFTPKPYRKWQHPFGVHSWMPFYPDILTLTDDPASIRPGFTILTQNQLSTLIASASYEYAADSRHLFHSSITWKGWYPVINSQFDYGYQPLIDDTVSLGTSSGYTGFRLINRIYVPFRFTSGRFNQSFFPLLSAEYINRYVYLTDMSAYDYGQTKFTSRIYFSNYYRSVSRDIYPRWKQELDISYTWAPFDKLIYGTDFSLKTAFYFPGLFPNNGIKIRYEVESQDFAKYYTRNINNFPRSYHNLIAKHLEFFSFDYFAPLFYPDLNISSIYYLKRIRTGIFYDYAEARGNYILKTVNGVSGAYKDNTDPEYLHSFGVEILSDFYLLRIPYMITGGVQSAWKNIYSAPAIEFIFKIDIYGMSIGRSRL